MNNTHSFGMGRLLRKGIRMPLTVWRTVFPIGSGTTQDDTAAAYWFTKMAKWGSARSQNKLGWAYANGVGVPQDDEQAVYWYRQAAEQGRAVAQENLGQCYGAGWGVPQDDVQAAVGIHGRPNKVG